MCCPARVASGNRGCRQSRPSCRTSPPRPRPPLPARHAAVGVRDRRLRRGRAGEPEPGPDARRAAARAGQRSRRPAVLRPHRPRPRPRQCRRGVPHRPAPRSRRARRPGGDRLARADLAGVLPGDADRPDGACGCAAGSASTTACCRPSRTSTSTSANRWGWPPTCCAKRSNARASGRCATSWRPSSPIRTIWCAPISTPRCASRARRAPARPRSACTVRRTCSTPIPSGCAGPACSSSGPNAAFLHYIAQVLPSLGEGGIEQATVDDLVGVLPANVRAGCGRDAEGRRADGRRAAPRRPRRTSPSRPRTSLAIIGTQRYRVGAHHLRRYVDDARRALSDGLRWSLARERLRTQVGRGRAPPARGPRRSAVRRRDGEGGAIAGGARLRRRGVAGADRARLADAALGRPGVPRPLRARCSPRTSARRCTGRHRRR